MCQVSDLNPTENGSLRRIRGLVAISGPSGSGKTTLVAKVCALTGYKRCVSFTTRPPRKGEQDGLDYHFVNHETFAKMEDRFMEHAMVSGHQYGTPKVDAAERTILTIDPQGVAKISESYPSMLKIFIAPPSKEELYKRLLQRGKDSKEVVERRMAEFEWFMMQNEMYDYQVVNSVLDCAVNEVLRYMGYPPHKGI